jgi:trans-aconitate methyltransferase
VGFKRFVVSQFARPRGVVGHLAGWIMARRSSNRDRNRWTLEMLGVEPGQRVLEIGFGPGFAIQQLVERFPTVRVTGIDHSEAMVDQARRRNRLAVDRGQVELRCLSVDDLRLLDGPFDRVYSSNVAQFWENRDRVFRDLLELLAPGGLVATTYLPRHSGASDEDAVRFGEQLVKEMRAAGFPGPYLELGPRVPLRTVCAIGERPLDRSV